MQEHALWATERSEACVAKRPTERSEACVAKRPTERSEGGTGEAGVAKRPTERSEGGTGEAGVAKRPTERSEAGVAKRPTERSEGGTGEAGVAKRPTERSERLPCPRYCRPYPAGCQPNLDGESRVRSRFSSEFMFQLFALLLSVVIVHSFYVVLIRPQAAADEATHTAQIAENPDIVPGQSIWIIVRDYEQETCFILMLWAMAILAYKWRGLLRQQALLRQDVIPIATGESILPEDARDYARAIEALPPIERDYLYPRALLAALRRFRVTRSVQDVSAVVDSVCETETDRLDSELALVRYIAWAIPSIGFIGTVRGIGQALGMAYKAVEGDITGVTSALGLAFNSTLIALILSIVLMFVLYQLQLMQERLVLDANGACDRNLIQHLQTR